jgi:hypothetical protein
MERSAVMVNTRKARLGVAGKETRLRVRVLPNHPDLANPFEPGLVG